MNAVSFSSERIFLHGHLQDQTHRELVYRRFQFHERSQHFIGTHDETLSVAVCVHNPDRSPFKVES
jgi:hypothetical protein